MFSSSKIRRFHKNSEREDGMARTITIIMIIGFVLVVGFFIFNSKTPDVPSTTDIFSGSATQRESTADSRVTSDVSNAAKYIESQIVRADPRNDNSENKVLVEGSPTDTQVQINKTNLTLSEGTTLTIQGTTEHYRIVGKNPKGFYANNDTGIIYDSAGNGMQGNDSTFAGPVEGEIISIP